MGTLGSFQSVDFHVITHLAATATETIPLMLFTNKAIIDVAVHITDAAVTGADTNTTHLNLIHGAGGTLGTEAATRDYTNTNDAVANDNTDMANGSLANRTVAAGSVLGLEYEKVGTGLLIPPGVIHIEYHYV